MSLSRFSFRTILTTVCLSFALVPLGVMTWTTWRSVGTLAQDTAEQYRSIAVNIADKIDRNLFERYGDVQAFGVNQVVQDTSVWGVQGEENPIVKAMNQYVDLYDLYYLTLLVDTHGKLIAVNTRDNNFQAIKTEALYAHDFSKEIWFNDALAGKFYESADGVCTGTVVEHLHVDESVTEIYGDEGLALGFTAPVKNTAGEVIAVWKNVAKFSVAEEIILSYYNDLKERGLDTAEITLLDDQGNVIGGAGRNIHCVIADAEARDDR